MLIYFTFPRWARERVLAEAPADLTAMGAIADEILRTHPLGTTVRAALVAEIARIQLSPSFKRPDVSLKTPPVPRPPRVSPTAAWDELLEAYLIEAGERGVDLRTLIGETGKSRDTIERSLKRLGAFSHPMPGHKARKLWFQAGTIVNSQTLVRSWNDDDDE